MHRQAGLKRSMLRYHPCKVCQLAFKAGTGNVVLFCSLEIDHFAPLDVYIGLFFKWVLFLFGDKASLWNPGWLFSILMLLSLKCLGYRNIQLGYHVPCI